MDVNVTHLMFGCKVHTLFRKNVGRWIMNHAEQIKLHGILNLFVQ